jgi:glycine cleavage system H protein
MFPADLKYTREHEWVRIEGSECVVGITDYAQEELGDVVFTELPDIQANVSQDHPFGAVESVKAVSDLFAPVSGKVIDINSSLEAKPELVNEDPYGEGWMIRVQIAHSEELDALMDVKAYEKLIHDLRS